MHVALESANFAIFETGSVHKPRILVKLAIPASNEKITPCHHQVLSTTYLPQYKRGGYYSS